MTLKQTKQALVWSQLPVNAGEVEIEVTSALAHLVATGQVDVFIDDSDGEIKFQMISQPSERDEMESIIDEISRG